MPILNIAAYRFVNLNDLPALQTALYEALSYQSIKGTVLLADEGINLFWPASLKHCIVFWTGFALTAVLRV